MGMGWRGRNVQFIKVPRHVFADPPYPPALEPPAQSLAQDVLIPGDNATAALVRQSIDHFAAWRFEAGEGPLLEHEKLEKLPRQR